MSLRQARLHLIDLPLERLLLSGEPLHLFNHIGFRSTDTLGDALKAACRFLKAAQRTLPANSFDSSYSGRDTSFADNFAETDIARPADVGPAAEFAAESRN